MNAKTKAQVIHLTNGSVTLVDACDFDKLSAFVWHDREGYVCRWSAHKLVRMHRVVMGLGLTDPRKVDHRNTNKHDNRRGNLRIATQGQNSINRGASANNASGLKGASFHRATGKFQASIRNVGKRKHLGYFATAEAAHAAYMSASREMHGEFHHTCEPSPHWWESHTYKKMRCDLRARAKRIAELLKAKRTAENAAALGALLKINNERAEAMARFVLNNTTQYAA